MLLHAWAMEQGECKKFEIGGCYLKGGFDSKDECQRACKGQDYQAPPWQCEQRPYLCPTSPNCIPPRC